MANPALADCRRDFEVTVVAPALPNVTVVDDDVATMLLAFSIAV
jgi:hypothetical protein